MIRTAAGLSDLMLPSLSKTMTASTIDVTTALKCCSARCNAVRSQQTNTNPSCIAAADSLISSRCPAAARWVACTMPPEATIAAGSTSAPTSSLTGHPTASSSDRP
jgi:hypothetical protein